MLTGNQGVFQDMNKEINPVLGGLLIAIGAIFIFALSYGAYAQASRNIGAEPSSPIDVVSGGRLGP